MEGFNILAGHLVGDFLTQNDWMAQGKKRSSAICLFHCAVYSCFFWSFTHWPWWAVLLVLVEHFIQDRGDLVKGYMKFIGQDKFLEPPMSPWSIIVVDNTFHLAFLWAVGGFLY